MNKDTSPKPETLVKVEFTQTVPDVSWYRHQSWEEGQFKRFRHFHTMSQDVNGFEFYNQKALDEPLPGDAVREKMSWLDERDRVDNLAWSLRND